MIPTVTKTVNRVKFTNGIWLFSRSDRSPLDFSLLAFLKCFYLFSVKQKGTKELSGIAIPSRICYQVTSNPFNPVF